MKYKNSHWVDKKHLPSYLHRKISTQVRLYLYIEPGPIFLLND